MSAALAVRWQWVAEAALLATVEAPDLELAVRASLALRERLAALDRPEIAELVPGAGSLLVLFGGELEAEAASSRLTAIETIEPRAAGSAGARELEVEVAYGRDDGPDLAAVAQRLSLTEQEVVARHAAPLYTVAFLGFSPGFPYLIGLPRELALPRLASPRPQVPAGSVAIAGAFAGIYPQATPGGWNLLGRTALSLFALDRSPAALLAPGDRLRFLPR